jgi:CrcB protein
MLIGLPLKDGPLLQSMQEFLSKGWKASVADHIAIAIGAMLGSSLRWLISTSLNSGTHFPFGTLTVNLVGCLLVGATQTMLLHNPARRVRLILVVGLLGGFTTFSTLSIETIQLLVAQRVSAALVYQGLTVSVGVGAVVLGSMLMHIAMQRNKGRTR